MTGTSRDNRTRSSLKGKDIASMVHRFLERLISKAKKEPFILDRQVPLPALLALMAERFVMRMRGQFFMNRRGPLYVGAKCIIKSRSRIRFGANVSIQRECHIQALSVEGITLGRNVSIQKRTIISCTSTPKHMGKGLVVGNNVGIGEQSFLGCGGGIVIGDDTIIGNYVSFHAENHNFNDPAVPIRLQGVNRQGITVGANCWFGAKSTILDGVVIEDGCVVAAGAVVTKGIYESNSILAGVPAKIIGKRF